MFIPIPLDGESPIVDFTFHLLPHDQMNSGSSRACDSVNKNKALRGRHPMLIVDCPDCEDSRALSFVFHPQEFHILSFILGIQYPNLID
ncbi:hypothetical protein Tco_0537833 [Tanacetum coccineum]